MACLSTIVPMMNLAGGVTPSVPCLLPPPGRPFSPRGLPGQRPAAESGLGSLAGARMARQRVARPASTVAHRWRSPGTTFDTHQSRSRFAAAKAAQKAQLSAARLMT
jgi:hypothetical protein